MDNNGPNIQCIPCPHLWFGGDGSGTPPAPPGFGKLTDEFGNYLTDEFGNVLMAPVD